MNWKTVDLAPDQRELWFWGRDWKGGNVVLGLLEKGRLEIMEASAIDGCREEGGSFWENGKNGWPTHWSLCYRPAPPKTTP